MHAASACASALALAHAALLAAVFFASSLATHAFVSTEIHALLFFRVCLTVLVFLELLAAGFFLFRRYPPCYAGLAISAVCLAGGGWAMVVAVPTESAVHFAGAILFIAATACYALPLLLGSRHARLCLVLSGTLTLAAAVSFAGLYFAQLYKEAAYAEWAAFTANAILLSLYFALNEPEPADAGRPKPRQGPAERQRLLPQP